jgi:hypothetical protein
MLGSPTPSPVLDSLAAAAVAAQQAYGAAFDKYLAQYAQADVYGFSPDNQQKFARDAFAKTPKGAKLSQSYLTAERALRSAKELGEAITITGRTWLTSDLSESAVAEVYRVAAKHGANIDRWPADVRLALVDVLNANGRAPTFGEVAESRRAALANLRNDVDQALDEHGVDPSRWPIEAIDRLALAQLRIDMFDQLVRRARALDPEWNYRSTVKE